MSFSIGWLDSLVFSMAPLGVITAIVGAIRLGGPSSLRGLIGRARETRAAAEVELMSSTSHEVCELWNGDAIVRVMGSPRIQQFFFFENLPDNYRDGKLTQNPTETKLPIFTMSGALGNVIVKRPKRRSLFNWHITKSKANDDEAGVTEPTKNIAPNISLNLNVEQKAWELYAAVVVGILTQVAVIGIATYTSYSPALQFNKAGLMIQSHSYPMACIGTLLLMTGMFVAASVVQQSTDEEKYELHPDLPKNVKLFVFWIQKGRVINDQNFDSYAIFVNDAVDVVRTSRRHSLEDNSDRNAIQHIQIFTVFGTVAAIAGFVLQFIGLRGLHWSASTAQLAATILMTVVRALLRREITTRPAAVKLEKGFELEWLATKL
ncbi:hypothetical protein BZA05DRAFT_360362, partial [Tricharina praecox]|uniref:uncharacterized protein n=1 Tax=Tricharina praecox TaxID=43433 RepID=UPI00221FC498